VLDFKEKNRLAAVSIHVNANFAEVKSLVDVLIKEMGMEMKGVKIVESEDSAFLEGRRADILRNGKKIGVFGEIHPEVILNFELDHPIVGLELDQDI
jgi:phenylalanyl-tRNA synthetase beta chain